jgi:hypothetical protein
VRNPADPVFGSDAATAHLAWQAAPSIDRSSIPDWEQPSRVAIGDGEVYVLDAMSDRVHAFSESGERLRSIGRSGRGPGEFVSSFGLAVFGEWLAVGNGGRNTVELYHPSGESAGSIPLGMPAFTLVGIEPAGFLVRTALGELKLFDVDGGAASVHLPPLMDTRAQSASACVRLAAAGESVLHLDCATPQFQVLSLAGDVQLTVRVRRSPSAATSAELDLYRSALLDQMAGAGGLSEGQARSLLDRLVQGQNPKPLMRGIKYDPTAEMYGVWEQQPPELGNGPARLHLFSRTGMFLMTVLFTEPWVDFAMDGLGVYALVEDRETGLVRLAAYRLDLDPRVVALARGAPETR